jgi:transcriptional regulator with XRE-family HTH domain
MTQAHIATLVKITRVQKGMSRRALGALANCTEQTILNFEHNTATIQLDTLLRLLNALKLELTIIPIEQDPEQVLADTGYTGDL